MDMLNMEISGDININVQNVDKQLNQSVNVDKAVFLTQVNPSPAEVIGAATQFMEQAEAATVARENRAAEVAGSLTIAEAEARHRAYVKTQDEMVGNEGRI